VSEESPSSDSATRCFVWYWGTSGAGIRFAHRVACEIGPHVGASNVCLSLHEENAWIDQAREEGFRVETISGPFGYRQSFSLVLSTLSRARALRRQLMHFKPHVMIVPMNFALAWPLMSMALMLRIPLIYVVHDASPHPGEYRPTLLSFTQSRLIKHATRLVTLSDFVRATLLYLYPSKTRTKPAVIPLSSHSQRRRDAAPLLEGRPVKFLFLGRLLSYKGLEVIASAARQLAHRDDWRLTIAGNGTELESLKQALGDCAQVDLSHLGWLTESEVDRLLETHHVLLCPYLEASQSGVISEASAYGMPTIATAVGGLADQIGNGRAGWMCEPGSPEALAAVMTQILDGDETYAQKAGAALASIPVAHGTTQWGAIVQDIARRSTA
jgi:glycosyltransferase involved in cell wall biosynthesis